MRSSDSERLILIAGATGYVGGRLREALESEGASIRCLARRPEFLRAQVGPQTEVVSGDCLDRSSLDVPLGGVHTAYYLVHSMGSAGDFERQDAEAARNFAEAAREAGAKRIIYLGGLAGRSGTLSPHLRSRHEVGEILRQSGIPVVEFRASIVIGSGSLSFELVRALVERLPVMICPRWVSVKAQPIAIEDLIDYLVAGLELPAEEHRIFEIGGDDVVSYGQIMREYARQRGLRRWMIPVPVLTPRLSSLWLGLVTPVYARIGKKLVDSIRHPSVVHDDEARRVFRVRPRSVREAIERALAREDRECAATRWCDAVSAGGGARTWTGVRFGNRLVDARTLDVQVAPEAAFRPIRRIGGDSGWYYANWLWRLRGFLDLVAGGVGLRRGRRDPESLREGDVVDFWRVEAYEPDRRLLLAAEMKLPGRAWLELEVTGEAETSTIRQTAIFDPVGLFGLAYWYALYPFHRFIFDGMLRGIAVRATADDAQQSADHPEHHDASQPPSALSMQRSRL